MRTSTGSTWPVSYDQQQEAAETKIKKDLHQMGKIIDRIELMLTVQTLATYLIADCLCGELTPKMFKLMTVQLEKNNN